MVIHDAPGVRRRWFMACAGGGSIGFAMPALVSATMPDVVALPIAGAIAGIVLGGFQAVALRSLLTGFGMRDWVLATAAGTPLASTVVSIFLRNGQWLADASTSVQASLAVAGALVLVFALGIAQWTVLRRWTERAVPWIVADAVGWTAGLVVLGLITVPLRQPVPAAAIELLAGLVLALVSAAVTGAFLGYVLEPRYVAAAAVARRQVHRAGPRIGRPALLPRRRLHWGLADAGPTSPGYLESRLS
ncbi:hypothetical protein AB0E01_39595 [Nocardia vinacea]|uniref:hypothetical protein n=1 Tax=Nocardia vinacea TaxID=96468 RepID=UPI0033ECFC6F